MPAAIRRSENPTASPALFSAPDRGCCGHQAYQHSRVL
jgi:hypothetical protein